MKITGSLELTHGGMFLGEVEVAAMIDDFGDVAGLYVIGSTGHFTPAGVKHHRIDITMPETLPPLLAGIAEQAWAWTRTDGFRAEIEAETGIRKAA